MSDFFKPSYRERNYTYLFKSKITQREVIDLIGKKEKEGFLVKDVSDSTQSLTRRAFQITTPKTSESLVLMVDSLGMVTVYKDLEALTNNQPCEEKQSQALCKLLSLSPKVLIAEEFSIYKLNQLYLEANDFNKDETLHPVEDLSSPRPK